MIKFVSDLGQVSGFLRVLHQLTDRHDITEKLLKVALNTITPNQTNQPSVVQWLAREYALCAVDSVFEP